MRPICTWLVALNATRQKTKHARSPLRVFANLQSHFLDLLFFRSATVTEFHFHPWVGQSLLSFFSAWLNELTFFIPKPLKVKKSRRRRLVQVKPQNFVAFKSAVGALLTEDVDSALAEGTPLLPTTAPMGNVLLTSYVVYRKFLTAYSVLGVSVDTTSPATKGAALLYYVEPLLYHDEFSGAQVLWLDPRDELTQPVVLCQSASLVSSAVASIAPADGFDLKLSRLQPARAASHPGLGSAPHAPTPLIVLDIPSSDLSLYTLALGALSFNPGKPSIISYVNSPAGIKSYTMRSRQLYRSGVLWCLALTSLAVLGPQYLFYGFTFVFSYWWALAALLALRSLGLLLWRLLPITTKFRIKNFYTVL